MNEKKIAERLANEVIAKKTEYQEFFEKMLKKHGVNSPDELEGDAKKKFFDEVDKGWKGKKETD